MTTRAHNPVREGLEETGLYHSFVLPNGETLRGAMSMQHQLERLASFGLPERLDGKRVLDIGPWDGFFTFEMERRGARVTAVDYADLDTFRGLHRAFGSAAEYLRMDVYELDARTLGTFDITLCLGVLYHLRYPIEGLERICAVTSDLCILDSFVCDGAAWLAGQRPELPTAEFYERTELGGQIDNWWGPSVAAISAWARAAGFAQTKLRRVTDTTACFAAYRHWQDLPPDTEAALQLNGLNNHANPGRAFHSSKEEYIELWAPWSDATPALDNVFPDVDGFGVPPVFLDVTDGMLHVSLRVPFGLRPGAHTARLKVGCKGWSQPVDFFIDLPDIAHPIRIESLQDGITWQGEQVAWDNGGWLTVWVNPLAPEADPSSVVVHISGIPHTPVAVDPVRGQVNVRLRPLIHAGQHSVRATHRGATSNTALLTVTGTPPPIRGLEKIASM